MRCFHCRLGLRNWLYIDDPWEEHARWNPNCFYINVVQGKEYVAHIQDKYRKITLKPSSGVFKRISDENLNTLLESDIIRHVLTCGRDRELVKLGLKQKLERTGRPFLSIAFCIKEIDKLSSLKRNEKGYDVCGRGSELEEHEYEHNRANIETSSGGNNDTGISESATGFSSGLRWLLSFLKRKKSDVDDNICGSGSGGDRSVASLPLLPVPATLQPPTPPPPLASVAESSSTAASEAITPTAEAIEEPSTTVVKKSTTTTKTAERPDDLATCGLCCNRGLRLLYFPCRHMMACSYCSSSVSSCPYCRQDIQLVIKPQYE